MSVYRVVIEGTVEIPYSLSMDAPDGVVSLCRLLLGQVSDNDLPVQFGGCRVVREDKQ